MEAEVANEINRIDSPYQSVEAADPLAQSNQRNNCGGMLSEFRVLIYRVCD